MSRLHRAILFAALVFGTCVPGTVLADCTPSFRLANVGGFGNRFNLYAWSMQVFQDRLYVGTFNQTTGGEIWAYDGTQWQQVLQRSLPETGNEGFRSMIVFDGHLYAGTYNTARGAEVWRTPDGVHWTQLVADGFGDVSNKAVRGIAVFQGHLYIGTQNELGNGGQLWRSADGVNFAPVSLDGFGDRNNSAMHSMAVFRKQLYIGTKNQDTMLQVWRTADGEHFEQVVGPDSAVPGGFGIPSNNATMSMYVYDGMLYIGTGNFDKDGLADRGFGVYRTRDGIRYGTINANGAGDIDNRFAWRFIEYEGQLWLGMGNFNILAGEGGQAARSPDGGRASWQMMVGKNGAYAPTGFGNWINWGVRSFAVYHDKLYVGTAQCWKPWCAQYVTGTEIWEWSGEACPAAGSRAVTGSIAAGRRRTIGID
jgi:uncharacterized membrane protein